MPARAVPQGGPRIPHRPVRRYRDASAPGTSPPSVHSSHLVVAVENRSGARRRTRDRVFHSNHKMRRMNGKDTLVGDGEVDLVVVFGEDLGHLLHAGFDGLLGGEAAL